jgi:class 3 adenylate cyclase/tetratricopeptide (TPR) repeat protein
VSAAAVCATCGATLPPDARFCPSCGAAVGTEPSREERRVVTVVFADIEGFTALAEQRDPESVKVLLDACFSRLYPVIAGHGGHVDKIIGDELMAVFGAPVAHDDDPERAVRAALALHDALADLDVGLRLRIGVNTGEVMAGVVGPSSGYTVTGDAVNTAHRLAGAAAPGEVLVGERTRHATGPAIDYRFRGDLDLKGKQDLVPAWTAAAPLAPTGRPRLPQADLVGRTRELDEIARRLAVPLTEGRAEVVTVVGEAGVGKTRLAFELAERMAAGPARAKVVWVTCPPYGPGGDLAPLGDVVRGALDLGAVGRRTAFEARLDRCVAAVAADTGTDETVLRSRLSTLLGLGPVGPRWREPETGPVRAGLTDQHLGAVRTVLAHAAAERPLLVVVDDLHWAGTSLLRFLGQIPDRLSASPIAVLALARDELLERSANLALVGPGRTTRTLDPLTDRSMAELAVSLLAAHPGADAPRLGPSASDRLVASAEGNPFVLEQLVQYLVESGLLTPTDDLWQLAVVDDDPFSAGLPDGIRSLIGARLDALPAEDREVVGAAAVVGREFSPEAVAELCGLDTVEDALERLDRKGIFETVGRGRPGDHRFRHVLTRDVAYAAVPVAARALRHARYAAWLESRPGLADDPGHVVQLAHHYERAVVLARTVDLTDPGLSGAAFDAVLRAARDEDRREGLRRSDHWYRRARDLGSPDPERMLAAVAEHGQVLLELRHLDAARDAFEEVQQRAGNDRPADEANALAHLGAIARLSGDADLARERFSAAARIARELDDVGVQVDVLRLEGWSDVSVGRFRAALPRLERAAALEAELEDAPGRGETMRHLGWCEYLAGDLAAARRHLQDAMACSNEVGDPGAVAWCFGLLASTYLHGGQATRTLEITVQLREVARSQGDPWGEWTCATLEAGARLALGQIERARALVEEATQRFEELDEAWGLALARVVHAQVARVEGDLDTARLVLMAARTASRETAHVGEDARIIAELSRVELDAGALDEAERHARAALALVRTGVGDHESGLRSLTVLAEVARREGRRDEAELLLEEAAGERAPEDRSDAWRQAAVALARLRGAAGDGARARELLDQAEDPPSDDILLAAAIAEARAGLAGAVG